MPTTTNYYMIVPASGTPRIVQRYPHNLRTDEVAFRLSIVRPNGWGRMMVGAVTVNMPEPPTLDSTVEQVDVPAVD